jgi:hypothetical protein
MERNTSSWGDSVGWKLARVVSLDSDTIGRKSYGTVKYFDCDQSAPRLVFFDLEYSANTGWTVKSVTDFGRLYNFSAPVISPQDIFSNIIPGLLKDLVADKLFQIMRLPQILRQSLKTPSCSNL